MLESGQSYLSLPHGRKDLGHISTDLHIIQCAVKSEIMVHMSPLQIINRKKTHTAADGT